MRTKSGFCFFLIVTLCLRLSVASAVGVTFELGKSPKMRLGGPLPVQSLSYDAPVIASPLVISQQGGLAQKTALPLATGSGQGGGGGILKTTAIVAGVVVVALLVGVVIGVVYLSNADLNAD